MRLLVTGGAGYIGSHVVWESLNQGHDVTIFDDLSTSNQENINLNAKFINGSVTSDLDLFNLFDQSEYDVVIHLAGKKSSGESMVSPQIYAENNIVGSIKLIKKCIDKRIKAFIFSSSAAVYGLPEYVPIDENHKLSPLNYYGYTKLVIENNLQWLSKLSGLKYISLRYFNAAGYDIKKRVISVEKNSDNLIPIVMEVANRTRKNIHVYGNDYNTKDGTGVRDYIHVNDLARAHIDAIRYVIKKKKNLTVNLGTGIGYSVLDIIKKTAHVSNKKINYDVKDRRAGDVGCIIAKSSYAKEVLDWEADLSNLDTIIKSAWEIYKKD